MLFFRIFFAAFVLIHAIPHSAASLSLKYQLVPHRYLEITYYYEEPVGQGDSLHGYYDPDAPVSGFLILNFSDFSWADYPSGRFTPDVERYSFTNGLRTFTDKNSYLSMERVKVGAGFELEEFGFYFDEDVAVGDWSTLYLANNVVESEFRYLYLPETRDACYDGEFGLCTEYAHGISRNAVTWTVSSVPTPGAIGALSTGVLLMGTISFWRRRVGAALAAPRDPAKTAT
jgi:hypothetical protein